MRKSAQICNRGAGVRGAGVRGAGVIKKFFKKIKRIKNLNGSLCLAASEYYTEKHPAAYLQWDVSSYIAKILLVGGQFSTFNIK